MSIRRERWLTVSRGARAQRAALLAVLGVAVGACGPSAVRTGPALPSSIPPARNACERETFYEAAPARVVAQGAEAGVFVTRHYRQEHEGVALFRPGSREPELLEDAWPHLHEPGLQRQHEARIEPVDAAHRRSMYWALGGLAAMAAGVGTAAAIEDSNRGAATAFGVGGLAMGLVGAIGALVAQPSGHDQLQADARRRLFKAGEDDLSAVRRGVDRNNDDARAACARER